MVLQDVTEVLPGDFVHDSPDFLPFAALPHINHLQGNAGFLRHITRLACEPPHPFIVVSSVQENVLSFLDLMIKKILKQMST